MENKIITIIRKATQEGDFEALNKIYSLYEQLQYSTSIKQMAEDTYIWLNKNFDITNMVFSLFDIVKDEKEEILQKGEKFYLDDEYAHFFIINTHTNLNAVVSFSASSSKHQEIILEKKDIIDSAFFQISPIIQNGILKKNYIDSSSLDSVTQVYNRAYLIQNLHKHLNLSKKKEKNMFFLMIGIDHFKAVIDEFSYDIGDKVLIELAKVIHSHINEFDMVARLNGDEFLLTLLNCPSKESAINIGKKIIEDFAKVEILVNITSNQTLKKTICIGLETFEINENTKTPTKAIKNADIALYEAKNKGRSTLFDYHDLSEEDTIELF